MKANPFPISRDEIRLLIPALPYGILDARQSWSANPKSYVANAGISKIYWNDDILKIKQRYDQTKEMGASEEWLKGLESEGSSYEADADRMSRWETGVIPGSNISRKGRGGSHSNVYQRARNPSLPLQKRPRNSPHHAGSHPSTRHERTASEVVERQDEIELRCLKLNPAMHANVLIHAPAFQAAIKSTQPLNDQEWQLLLPKLNAERPSAEKAAKQHQEEHERLQRRQEERRRLEWKEKEEWVRRERIWEESQVSVREMLGKIVDSEIKAFGEKKIDKLVAPRFAVKILVNTRIEYYRQVCRVPRPEEEKPKIIRLVLENMKWIFETKLKPLTEPWRKDLFRCRGCGDTVPKLYCFHGVIQHYLAKHISEMSRRKDVHWRAEWPEDPPFADPTAAKKKIPPQKSNRGAPCQSFYRQGQQPSPIHQGYGAVPSFLNDKPLPHLSGPYEFSLLRGTCGRIPVAATVVADRWAVGVACVPDEVAIQAAYPPCTAAPGQPSYCAAAQDPPTYKAPKAPKAVSNESISAAELFLRDFMTARESEAKGKVSADGPQREEASAQAMPSGRMTGSDGNPSLEKRPADAPLWSRSGSQGHPTPLSDIQSRRYHRLGRRRSITPREASSRNEYSLRSTLSRPNFSSRQLSRGDDFGRCCRTLPERARSPSSINSAGRYNDRLRPPVPGQRYICS